MTEPHFSILTGIVTLGSALFMLYVGSSAFAPFGPELTGPVMVGMFLFAFVKLSHALNWWRSKRAAGQTRAGKR